MFWPFRRISVKLVEGVVVWNGETAPITNYFFDPRDGDGFDLARVQTVVAGPYSTGEWLPTAVTDRERANAARVH